LYDLFGSIGGGAIAVFGAHGIEFTGEKLLILATARGVGVLL
jgi:hypothetical protein